MKNRHILKSAIFGLFSVALLTVGVRGAAFTAGNIVVYRVGTGTGTLSSSATAVFLDEYTVTGTLVQSIAAPTSVNGLNLQLTASGSASNEGLLNLSVDGTALLFTGYGATLGTATVASSPSTTVPRVVGVVGADGVVDTTTSTTSFGTGGIRTVASTNGTDIWVAGSTTGIIYTTKGGSGAGTTVSTTVTNSRSLDIFGGQLYVSSGAGTIRLGAIGSGTPTSSGQTTTPIPGLPTVAPTAFNEFIFLDLSVGVVGIDTLYLADDGNNVLAKYSLVGGTWMSNGTIAQTGGFRGLTGSALGSNVTLFGTTPSNLYTFTDSTGYNGALTGTLTSIATAGTNTAFRGVDFAPIPEPSSALALASGVGVLLTFRPWRRRVS
jgi:hypothetical protein